MMATDLTHSQMQIWVGQQLHLDCPLYNMAFAFVFSQELHSELFCEAWSRVVAEHEVLRMRIDETGDRPQTVQAPDIHPTVVLQFAPRPDAVEEFHRWCRERCAHTLPLSGPLLDSVLVQLGAGRSGWYLNQHHLLADAWSTQLLYRQVGAHYKALLHGDRGQHPAPLTSYEAAAAGLWTGSEQGRLAQQTKARQHWATRQGPPPPSLPFYGHSTTIQGTQQSAQQSTASTRRILELDEVRSQALDRLSRQPGFASLSSELSRFALFATLLLSWLHRISGLHDLRFDAPVAGRPTPESKRALGLFIEMFPFAATIRPGETFRSLAASCLEEAKLFLRHALPTMSSPSGASASKVVLNFFPGVFGPFGDLPCTVDWVHSGHGDSVHTLRLQVHDFAARGRITLHFDCNEAALPEHLWRRSLEHFENLLTALLEDPDCEIASVDLQTVDERRALAALNTNAWSSPLPERTVVEMFEAQARRTPQRVALRQGQLEVSFAHLQAQAETLATTLVERGIQAGERVAIYSRRSTLAVLSVLATLRARAAFVPLDPSLPQARLEHLLRDSGCRLLLLGEGVEAITAPGVDVISVAAALRTAPGKALDRRRPGLDDLSYLLYTSGSTGQPKGVLIEHGGLADYLSWASRTYVRGDRLNVPLFTSLAFDLTLTSLFLPLITGGTLEIYPEPEGAVDAALIEVVRSNAVEFIKLTPSHLALLARLDLAGSKIRRMVVGGEQLTTPLAATISDHLPTLELYNEYGPTEAVVGCVVQRYDPTVHTATSVPIGVPADHVEVEVLNESLAPVPQGVAGELWISRHGLARGYHRRPGLTAERFLPHPGRPGERRYRTGDLVRQLDAGRLEYLGRLDRQLKVSGFRVEPGEIEAALLTLPGIEQCAVVPRRRPLTARAVGGEIHHCTRCGLPSNYPRAAFDEQGLCAVCRTYESIKDHAQAYFKTMDDLRTVVEESARRKTGDFDCMMLYSGGKDSSYALCQLVEMGIEVYAFTLDNGFLSDGAKDNIRNVSQQLGVTVELATTPAMNAIFRDSLLRFSNVCNGCFKTIYTLSMQRARELGIPLIVTGLSRGQMFETRLTEEMFRDGRRDPQDIDAAVLAARKLYHRTEDEVSRSLDVKMFADDRIFEELQFVDFYRYCDVGLEEVYSYLARKIPWVRPQDTGRSTNCLINDIGIYVHKNERGYHNYALPYSWDVRLGHKTRQEALDELDDEIDVHHARRTLAAIGYEAGPLEATTQPTTLAAFYVAAEEIDEPQLRRLLSERLPPQLIPRTFQRLESIPWTASGKLDEDALIQGQASETIVRRTTPYRAPEGPVEEYLVALWQEELAVDGVGADDSFFALGGTSLNAMQVMLRLCNEFALELPLDSMFSHPTLRGLAKVAEDMILAEVAPPPG